MNYRNLVKTNTDLFFKRLAEIASRLNFPTSWLEHIIYMESGFNHKAVNSIGAAGLIQFTRQTANGLGTNKDELIKMSNVQQLDFVEKYFKNQIQVYGVPRSLLDAYLLVFYPVMVNKPDSYSIPHGAYAANKGMDANKDGKITKEDVRKYMEKRLGISVSSGKYKILWLLGIPVIIYLFINFKK